GRLGTRGRSREGIARSREAIERLLDFEADLLRDLFLAQHDLTLGCAGLAHARLVTAAIEQPPGEYQRRHAEVVAIAETVIDALRAGVHPERQGRPLLLACDPNLLLRGLAQLVDARDFRTAVQCRGPQLLERTPLSGRGSRRRRHLDAGEQIAIQQEI